MQLYLSNPEL